MVNAHLGVWPWRPGCCHGDHAPRTSSTANRLIGQLPMQYTRPHASSRRQSVSTCMLIVLNDVSRVSRDTEYTGRDMGDGRIRRSRVSVYWTCGRQTTTSPCMVVRRLDIGHVIVPECILREWNGLRINERSDDHSKESHHQVRAACSMRGYRRLDDWPLPTDRAGHRSMGSQWVTIDLRFCNVRLKLMWVLCNSNAQIVECDSILYYRLYCIIYSQLSLRRYQYPPIPMNEFK